MTSLESVLRETLSPQLANAAAETLDAMRTTDVRAYGAELLNILTSPSKDEPLRFLAAIYIAQLYKDYMSFAHTALYDVVQKILQEYLGYSHRIRRVLCDMLGNILGFLFTASKWDSAFSDVVSMLHVFVSSSSIDVDAYTGPLSKDFLQALSDILGLITPHVKTYAYIELDDVIALRLLKIIKAVSETVLAVIGLLVRSLPHSGTAEYVALNSALAGLFVVVDVMYTLEDLPAFYEDHYLQLASAAQHTLAFLDQHLLSLPAHPVDAALIASRISIVDFLCDAIMNHFDKLPNSLQASVRILLDVAVAALSNAMYSRYLDPVVTEIIARLRRMYDSVELQDPLMSFSEEIFSRLLLPALNITNHDLEQVASDDTFFLATFLGSRDLLSRRAVAEDMLASLALSNPSLLPILVGIIHQNLAASSSNDLQDYLTRVQAIILYRAASIKGYTREKGAIDVVQGSNLPEFFGSVIEEMMRYISMGLAMDTCPRADVGHGHGHEHDHCIPENLDAAKTLLAAEVSRFIVDFRNLLGFDAVLQGCLFMFDVFSKTKSLFLCTTLICGVASIVSHSKHVEALRKDSRITTEVYRICSLSLPADMNTVYQSYLFHDGNSNEHIAEAFVPLLQFIQDSVTPENLLGILNTFVNVVLPVMIKGNDRAVFVHAVFNCYAAMLAIFASAAPVRTKDPGMIDLFEESLGQFLSLFGILESKEDFYHFMYQILYFYVTIAQDICGSVSVFDTESSGRVLHSVSIESLFSYCFDKKYYSSSTAPALSMLLIALLSAAGIDTSVLVRRSQPLQETYQCLLNTHIVSICNAPAYLSWGYKILAHCLCLPHVFLASDILTDRLKNVLNMKAHVLSNRATQLSVLTFFSAACCYDARHGGRVVVGCFTDADLLDLLQEIIVPLSCILRATTSGSRTITSGLVYLCNVLFADGRQGPLQPALLVLGSISGLLHRKMRTSLPRAQVHLATTTEQSDVAFSLLEQVRFRTAVETAASPAELTALVQQNLQVEHTTLQSAGWTV